jgi:tetratricopeptide (TPR) repeat protein
VNPKKKKNKKGDRRIFRNKFACPFFLLLLGCRSAPLPPLPHVVTSSFLPSIRQEIETAQARAESHPNDPGAVGRLGMVFHAHDQLGAARQCYQRASLLDPKNFDWIYYWGVASDGTEKIQRLRAALRLRDFLPARIQLGDALLSQGDSAGARDVLHNLEHPAAWFAYGRATNDSAYYRKALDAFPQYGAAMFALAQHYQRAGQSADAQRLMAEYPRYKTVAPPLNDPLMDAVRALHRGPDKLLADAIQLEAQGHLRPALDLEMKAIALDPRLTQAHVNLISLYGRLEDPANAEKHYRQAIALDPNSEEAYYNFGVLCYQSQRRGEAKTAFLHALSLDPNHAEAHNNLGALLEEQGQLAEAAQHFRKAIELQPGLRLARFHLGRILANQRRYSQAIEQFQHAVEVDDESTPAYLYALGATQARAGDFPVARSTLSAARDKAAARGQSALVASIERDLAKLKR